MADINGMATLIEYLMKESKIDSHGTVPGQSKAEFYYHFTIESSLKIIFYEYARKSVVAGATIWLRFELISQLQPTFTMVLCALIIILLLTATKWASQFASTGWTLHGMELQEAINLNYHSCLIWLIYGEMQTLRIILRNHNHFSTTIPAPLPTPYR